MARYRETKHRLQMARSPPPLNAFSFWSKTQPVRPVLFTHKCNCATPAKNTLLSENVKGPLRPCYLEHTWNSKRPYTLNLWTRSYGLLTRVPRGQFTFHHLGATPGSHAYPRPAGCNIPVYRETNLRLQQKCMHTRLGTGGRYRWETAWGGMSASTGATGTPVAVDAQTWMVPLMIMNEPQICEYVRREKRIDKTQKWVRVRMIVNDSQVCECIRHNITKSKNGQQICE